jgi:hypothetical protein
VAQVRDAVHHSGSGKKAAGKKNVQVRIRRRTSSVATVLTSAIAIVAAVLPAAVVFSPAVAEARHTTSIPEFQVLATSDVFDLQGAWSKEPGSDLGSNFDHSSPVIADLDGAGPLRTAAFVATHDGCIHAFTYYTGQSKLSELPGFPACVGTYVQSSPAVADLDGNGVAEIVIGAGKLYHSWDPDQWRKDFGGIWIFWNGNTQARTHYRVSDGVFSTPAVGDMDGDGRPEIVFGGFDMYVRALNWDGSHRWSIYIADTVWSSPALTKIPGQDRLAAVIGTDLGGGNPGGHLGCPQYWDGYLVRGFLLAVDPDGRVLPGFPKCLDTPIWSSPAIVDLDRDGWADAVFGTNNYYENGANVGAANRVHAIRLWNSFQNGTWVDDKSISYLPGWPAYISTSNGRIFTSPAVGDMDGDGYPEVAISDIRQCPGDPPNKWDCGRMSIFDYRGVRTADVEGGDPGYSQSFPFTGSPVIADVAGDSRPEALFPGGEWHLHAIDKYGNFLGTFFSGDNPRPPLGRQFRNSPAVGDLDGDSQPEIFLAGGTYEDPARGAAWVLRPLKSNPSPGPWPYFKRDARRRANAFDPFRYLFRATAGNAKVRLEWKPLDVPAARTRIVRRVAPSCPTSAFDGTLIFDGSGSTVTDTAVSNGTTYCYGAFFSDGSTAFSSPVFAQATPLPPPAPPSGVRTRTEDGQVLLFWSNPSGNNFQGVRVVRKSGSSPPSNPYDGVVVYDGAGTSYIDYGLANGTEYSYALFAHNGIPEYSGPAAASGLSPGPHAGLPYAFFVGEGYTGNPGFASIQYLTLGNNETTPAEVVLTFYPESGEPREFYTSVPAKSRRTVVTNAIVGPDKAVGISLAVREGPGVLLERPMYFYGNPGTGSVVADGHNALGEPSPRTEWYFAEGYTGTGFVEYLTILNPSGIAASRVRFDFVFSAGPPQSLEVVVPPHARRTYNVNSIVGPGREVSTKVSVVSGGGVVAERAMYFAADPALGAMVRGGHAKPGAKAAARKWYFAEGYTGSGFVEYLTLQNPDPMPSVAQVRFQFNPGTPPITRTYDLPGNSRTTIRVNDVVGPGREVSVEITVPADRPPIVAERPMYFSADPLVGSVVTAGHDTAGALAPAKEWIFSEGYTGAGFVEWLTIQNPSTTSSSTVRFEYVFNDGGLPVVYTRVLGPSTRTTFNVNADVGPGREVSVRLTVISGDLVVCERPMYFAADPALGAVVRGGTVSFGFPGR